MFNMLGLFLQKIIDLAGLALDAIFYVLPTSPFALINKSPMIADLIAKINYFIPVYEFVAIGQAWLVCVGIFYVYSIYARWVKAIQ